MQIVLRRDAHHWNGRLLKLTEHQSVIAQRRQQDDPLQTQLSEQGINLLFDVRALDVPGFHHEMYAGFPAAFDGARLKLAEIVAGSIAKESDEKRAIAGQTACVQIWAILELIN